MGWNIHSARLSTWGGNARNAYYLTDTEGRKIPAEALSLLDALLPQIAVGTPATVRSTSLRPFSGASADADGGKRADAGAQAVR